MAASNYFREDSVPETVRQEQEQDSASDWYGSVGNQQNQDLLIAAKLIQINKEKEQVQGDRQLPNTSTL